MMPIKLKHLLVLLLCFSSYFCWSNPIDAEHGGWNKEAERDKSRPYAVPAD